MDFRPVPDDFPKLTPEQQAAQDLAEAKWLEYRDASNNFARTMGWAVPGESKAA